MRPTVIGVDQPQDPQQHSLTELEGLSNRLRTGPRARHRHAQASSPFVAGFTTRGIGQRQPQLQIDDSRCSISSGFRRKHPPKEAFLLADLLYRNLASFRPAAGRPRLSSSSCR